MFDLFKRAGELRFQLFKIAYSLREELDWVRTPAGRKRLGGLLWELARAPASEDAINRAADELLAFIGAATPSGLDDNAAGESAWWLRGIALGTPYGSWPGLMAAAAGLRSDLAAYWEGRSSIKDLFGARVAQLSGVSGASGLRELIGKLGPAQAEAERQQRVERLRKIEAERAALPTGQLQLLGVVGDWRIEVPHDGAAAAHAGHGSSWCTARKSNKYFSDYHKPVEGQFIYVFTNQANGSRYQATFHPGGKVEVRDEADNKVDNAVAAELYRVLRSAGELPSGAEELRNNSHALDLGPLGVRLGRPSTNSEGAPHADGAPAYRAVDPKSGSETTAHYQDGLLHREDGPAIEVNRGSGTGTQIWYRNGVPWNGDGPAMVYRSKTSTTTSHLEPNGKIGRDPREGPADITYRADGSIVAQRYMRDGRLVPPPDPNAPAFDSVVQKRWVNSKGETHRIGAPALVHTSELGPAANHEEWYENDKRHRKGGPAITGYGGMVNQYWLYGKRVREDGTPYADGMAAAIDDMDRIDTLDSASGLDYRLDVIKEEMRILRNEVLRGEIASEDELEDRVRKILHMMSQFTFSNEHSKQAAIRALNAFQDAGEARLG